GMAGELCADAAVTALVHRHVDARAGDALVVGAIGAVVAVDRRPDALAVTAAIPRRAGVPVVTPAAAQRLRDAAEHRVAHVGGTRVAVLAAGRRAGHAADGWERRGRWRRRF